MKIVRIIFLCIIIFIGSTVVYAENIDLDVLLGEFDDTVEEVIDNKTNISTESDMDILDMFDEVSKDKEIVDEVDKNSNNFPFDIDGYFKLSTACNFNHKKPVGNKTDYRGFSKLKSELQLELTYKFTQKWKMFVSGKGSFDSIYILKGRDDYTDDALNTYESELVLKDTYIEGSLSRQMDIKIGRQIVVWGTSDNIRVVDIINPLDLREPGLVDIEDIRLPVSMSKVDLYIGQWNLSFIAIHEHTANIIPEYGSDFSNAIVPLPDEDLPDNTLSNTGYAMALKGIFSGFDLSFYMSDLYSHTSYLELDNIDLERKYARLQMMGVGTNIALGNWLVKAEFARIAGLQYFGSNTKYFRDDMLIGAEYSGFTDTTIGVEFVDRYLENIDNSIENAPNNEEQHRYQSAIRIQRDFLHDRLKLTLLLNTFGLTGEDGSMQRFSGEYELMDSMQLIAGVLLYSNGDLAAFKSIEDKDRLFVEIKYSF